MSNFFYTWNMVQDFFITNLQDLNKVESQSSMVVPSVLLDDVQTAVLGGAAPDPVLHHPTTGALVPLLSTAPSLTTPLVINFGSCT